MLSETKTNHAVYKCISCEGENLWLRTGARFVVDKLLKMKHNGENIQIFSSPRHTKLIFASVHVLPPLQFLLTSGEEGLLKLMSSPHFNPSIQLKVIAKFLRLFKILV